MATFNLMTGSEKALYVKILSTTSITFPYMCSGEVVVIRLLSLVLEAIIMINICDGQYCVPSLHVILTLLIPVGRHEPYSKHTDSSAKGTNYSRPTWGCKHLN